MENKDKEFTEEELMNVQGAFPHMADNTHPFDDEEIYGESQKAKLEALKEQLKELENSPLTRGGRR